MAQDSLQNRSKIHDFADSDPGQSLGAFLQRERTKKKFTLDQVAEETCIHIATLRAIENNDRSKMPAEVFSRGFIKLYAKFLGLDQQDILERYSREMAHADEDGIRNHDVFFNEKMAESFSFFNARKIVFFLFFFALIGLGYYFFLYSESPRSNLSSLSLSPGDEPSSSTSGENLVTSQDSPPDKIEAQLPEKGGDSSAGAPLAHNFATDEGAVSNTPEKTLPASPSDQPPPQATSPETDVPSPESESPAADGMQQTAPAVAAQPPPVEALPEEVNLRILFTQKTWLQVTLDDQPGHDYLFNANEERSWSAAKKIRLYIGNSGGVRLFLKDKELPINGKPGSPLRLTIPDDLAR
ncbi:MAG: helix-turn-helix domain-containing protein [Deltaproteobacteria bacterium]|nr:helix-turn-helix domain-containing protein [Deltaproteobacteria bacterium]